MTDSQKADQIAFHFYTKLFNVVSDARAVVHGMGGLSGMSGSGKRDKWFNLETPDSELFTKEERERYRSVSSFGSLTHPPTPPPLEIQVLLTVPDLTQTQNQVLVQVAPDSSRVRIDPTPRYVLLEEYVLHFVPVHSSHHHAQTSGSSSGTDVPLPTIYKHGIPLFRSLYTLLRLLPAWKLHKRLRRRIGTGPSLGITLRVRRGNQDDEDVLSLMKGSNADTHTFPSVPHPSGSLSLTATYLVHPTFQLDDLESLLSSGFLSLDQRPFTPTLAAKNNHHHIRSSSTTTTSSSPSPTGHHAGSQFCRSPPRIATGSGGSYPHPHSSSGIPLPLPDRGNPLLPPAPTPPRLTSVSGRPSPGPVSAHPVLSSGASSTRGGVAPTARQGGLSSSSLSSPTNSFFAPASGTHHKSANVESAGASTSTSSRPPSRPQPQYPFPFKSNTVSSGNVNHSGGSLGSAASSSPVGLGFGSGGFPSSVGSGSGMSGSGLSERKKGYMGDVRDRVVSLEMGSGSSLAGLRAGAGSRMSVHSRESSVSASGAPGEVIRTKSAGEQAPRKRYSSSFGHRYGSPKEGGGTPGSVGSAAGVGLREENEERRRSVPAHPPVHGHSPHPHSPLSPHYSPSSSGFMKAGSVDDDEISVFVQEIDSRKMLRGAGTGVSSSLGDGGSGQRWLGSGSGEREKGEGSSAGLISDQSSRDQIRRRPLLREGESESYVRGRLVSSPPSSNSSSGPATGIMLTSEREVDERLRRMNEAFWGSLEGLGGAAGGRHTRHRSMTGMNEVENGVVEPLRRFRTRMQSLTNDDTAAGSGENKSEDRYSSAIPIRTPLRRQASITGEEGTRTRTTTNSGVRSGGHYYLY